MTQKNKAGNKPAAFCSRKLSDAKEGYSVQEEELLAVLFALRTWPSFLYESKFKTLIVHQSFNYLDSQENSFRKQVRWVAFMQEFNYSLQ